MGKVRLEALSDAVFAIVMTLLVIDIQVPELAGSISSFELRHAIEDLGPLFAAYFMSFAILAMFWMSHNFFYEYYVKSIDRVLPLLNITYLAFIALIPFSTRLIGSYPNNLTAVLWYGCNVFILGSLALIIFLYSIRAKEVENNEIESRIQKQVTIRFALTPSFALLGMVLAPFSISLAFFFFAFPIFFNIIPGLLNAIERLLGFHLE